MNSTDSTVDPLVMHMVRFLHRSIRGYQDFDGPPINDILAALYALKEAGFVITGHFYEKGKEHWFPSHLSIAALQLGSERYERKGVWEATLKMGMHVLSEPDGWIAIHRGIVDEYINGLDIERVMDSWRMLGSVIITMIEKMLVFTGHELEGGWVFRITKKGEKAGAGPKGYYFQYSLNGPPQGQVSIVAQPLELL